MVEISHFVRVFRIRKASGTKNWSKISLGGSSSHFYETLPRSITFSLEPHWTSDPELGAHTIAPFGTNLLPQLPKAAKIYPQIVIIKNQNE